MTTPTVFTYPVKRPGFITGVTWNGQPNDEKVSLSIEFVGANGLASQTVLYSTGYNGIVASLCLPTGKTINDVSEDCLVAHIRMAGMIAGQIPGSDEYEDAITGSGLLSARNFQTPIGDAKVTNVQSVDERLIRLTWQKSSGGITRDIDADVQDLSFYQFAPSTQLLTVAGAIKKEFPSYQHDHASGKHLTQAQMDTISAYVMSLEPWI